MRSCVILNQPSGRPVGSEPVGWKQDWRQVTGSLHVCIRVCHRILPFRRARKPKVLHTPKFSVKREVIAHCPSTAFSLGGTTDVCWCRCVRCALLGDRPPQTLAARNSKCLWSHKASGRGSQRDFAGVSGSGSPDSPLTPASTARLLQALPHGARRWLWAGASGPRGRHPRAACRPVPPRQQSRRERGSSRAFDAFAGAAPLSTPGGGGGAPLRGACLRTCAPAQKCPHHRLIKATGPCPTHTGSCAARCGVGPGRHLLLLLTQSLPFWPLWCRV